MSFSGAENLRERYHDGINDDHPIAHKSVRKISVLWRTRPDGSMAVQAEEPHGRNQQKPVMESLGEH